MDDRTRDLVPSDVGSSGDSAAPLALIVVHSPDTARRDSVIPLDRPVTIGRHDAGKADVGLDDVRVSRQHAQVRPRADRSGADIEDLNSRNGLFLDRARTTSAFAKVGSVLRAGDTIFILSHPPGRQPQRRPSGLAGRSALLLELLSTCESYAPSDLPILLLGETGTGKEVFAAAIHELSGRRGPSVTLNCAAIPRELGESLLFGHVRGAFTGATAAQSGAFAQAQGGTLFLDEVGELAPDVQAKLLRALENREFTPIGSTTPKQTDARIVAATNMDLRRAADAGEFRQDLYARLAGGVLRLPPLRQRREDIPDLTRHFLGKLSSDEPVPWTANFAELLVTHHWPMNARELRMTMQRLLLQTPRPPELRGSDLLAVLDLVDDEVGSTSPRAGSKDGDEDSELPSREELAALLATYQGNVSAIAKHYRRDRKQVYRWLRRYDLSIASYR